MNEILDYLKTHHNCSKASLTFCWRRALAPSITSTSCKTKCEFYKLSIFIYLFIYRFESTYIDLKALVYGKRQKWNFSALRKVKLKYLYLLWIVRDNFLFLCDLFKDYKKKIENQR